MFGSWLLAYGLTLAIPIMKLDGKVAEIAIDGCTTYMIVIAVTYLTSHSIDRAALLEKVMDMAIRRKR